MKFAIYRALALLALLTSSALAQHTSISGKVTDSSRAVVVNASVAATRTDGGTGYRTVTNTNGVFQFPSIVASNYVVSVEAVNFAKAEKSLTVLLGQELSLDFNIVPAAAQSTVNVSSAVELIDTTTSQVAGNVDPVQTSKLPLNGNNWMQLVQVVPGIRVNAIDAAPLDQNSTGTFQIILDGQQVTQTNEYSWKGEPEYSRDAIAEFQVVTNRFDATQGRSSLLVISAQTKSGTDSIHGGAFGYFRNDAFNAADPIAHKVLPFSDQLYGGTIGGAIRKNKLFYFGSYEGERNPTTSVSNPVGFATWSETAIINTEKYLARFDYKLNPNDSFSLRLAAHTYHNPAYGVSGTTNPSSLENWRGNSYNTQLTYNHIFSSSLVNEVRVADSHNYYGQDVLYNAPQLIFPTTTVGGDIYAPTKQNQENLSFREDLFWLRGKHSIKIGTELIRVLEHGIYSMQQNGQAVLSAAPGQAGTALAGLTWASVFPNLFDASTWNLAALNPVATNYTQTFGDPHFRVPRETFATWIQDDWRISRRFTLNLGLRYDNDFGVFNSHVTLPSSWGIKLPTHGDNDEFGPRGGFAWDPKGNGKTSIRGGVGLYYADIMGVFTKKSELVNGLTWVTPSIAATPGNPIDLTNPFGGTTAATIRANPLAYKQALMVLSPNIRFPRTVQASIGVQRELPTGVTVSVDYLHDRSTHSPIGRESNVYQDPATGFNLNLSTAGRPNPLFGSITEWSTPSQVGDIYDALLINVQKLHWHKLSGTLAYTFSREKDNDSENNPFNFADWGPSVSNQTHTLNPTASYQFKWSFRSSLVYHYGSGANFATSVGTSPTGLGANGVAALANRSYCGADATYTGCPAKRVVTYNNPINNHLDAASGLDITNRDSLVGRSIQRVDLNLAKDITLTERFRATLQVEAFNVLNHANYGAYTTSINNPLYGHPATSTDPAYWPRSLQFSARLAF
jgi:hypothetical protein